MKIKVSDLNSNQLSWAYLFSMYGDGPDWRVVDGIFGIVYLRDVRIGMDGHGDAEEFQEFCPHRLYGASQVRAVVRAKLGEEVEVPEGLLS